MDAAQRVNVHITVAGDYANLGYDRCAQLAQTLANDFASVTCEILPMSQTDWEEWVGAKSREIGGNAYEHEAVSGVMVYYNGCNYVGAAKEFFVWARRVYDHRVESAWLGDARRDTTLPVSKEFRPPPTARASDTYCYIDLTWEANEGVEPQTQRLFIELYDSFCPKTCANFRALCSDSSERGYAGTPVHRIVKDGYAQMGDNDGGRGNGGSAADGATFADECFTVGHGKTGIVSMANKGAHTNGSQFFITMKPLPFLDRNNVSFGRVVSGMSALRAIQEAPIENQRPKGKCFISAAGIVPVSQPAEAAGSKIESKEE
eukprot:g3264.t1